VTGNLYEQGTEQGGSVDNASDFEVPSSTAGRNTVYGDFLCGWPQSIKANAEFFWLNPLNFTPEHDRILVRVDAT
jgi:hypothetical protein